MGIGAQYGIGSVKPGVCTSTTRPASPYDGQVIYETDTDGVFVYNSSSWIPYGIRQNFTPSWTNFTLGNGTTNYATYTQIGDLVIVEMKVTFGSTTTISSGARFNLPVGTAQQSQYAQIGTATYHDVGVALWAGFIYMWSGGSAATLGIFNVSATYPSYADISSTIPFTWGNTDYFEIVVAYSI